VNVQLHSIGLIRSSRIEPAERGHGWSRENATVELHPDQFDASSLRGLETFSHLELVFVMDRVDRAAAVSSRHPGGRTDWPDTGIFAQRFSVRPNAIGVTRCRILGVSGLSIAVGDCDALDGTPVLDVKPWFRQYGPRGTVLQPAWVDELMQGYWE
jgi:tRNA-Thr(GGU) m(6)t(6)A37 methyltransferase TsaA